MLLILAGNGDGFFAQGKNGTARAPCGTVVRNSQKMTRIYIKTCTYFPLHISGHHSITHSLEVTSATLLVIHFREPSGYTRNAHRVSDSKFNIKPIPRNLPFLTAYPRPWHKSKASSLCGHKKTP